MLPEAMHPHAPSEVGTALGTTAAVLKPIAKILDLQACFPIEHSVDRSVALATY